MVCRGDVNRGREIAGRRYLDEPQLQLSQALLTYETHPPLGSTKKTDHVLLLGEVYKPRRLPLPREVTEQPPFPGCWLSDFSICIFFPMHIESGFTGCWICKLLYSWEDVKSNRNNETVTLEWSKKIPVKDIYYLSHVLTNKSAKYTNEEDVYHPFSIRWEVATRVFS